MRTEWPQFLRLWNDLGLKRDGKVRYEALVQLYSGPGRRYHNLQHIGDCLQEFDSAAHLAVKPLALEMAIWFHDAIYDSHAHDNEVRSADLAREWLAKAQCPEPTILDVVALILTTQHTAIPFDPDSILMVDIDLSILGRTEAVFRRYEEQIRQEYSWVPDQLFANKRAQILSGFLSRDRIFGSQLFYQKYETAARANLVNSIAHWGQIERSTRSEGG